MLTNNGRNLALYALYTTENLANNGRPTQWWVALHTADPGSYGDEHEVSGSGYARQQVSLSVGFSGAASNTNELVFPTVTGTPYTVTHVTVWDSQFGGSSFVVGALDLAKLMAVNDAMDFAIGALNLTMA